MSLVERAIDKMRREEPGAARRTTDANKPPVRVPAPAPATAAAPHSAGAAPVARAQPGSTPTSVAALAPGQGSGGRHAVGQAKLLVDRAALRALGYLPDSRCDRQFAGHYRQIKRPLIAAALEPPEPGTPPGPSRRLVMMASALPGDGKTFTSINLALSMARESDISVLLVDGDVAKPHVSSMFGVSEQRGLVDALADRSLDVESLVLSTDVPGLSILPAGGKSVGATELLASARMGEVMNHLLDADPRRLVLVDSSPLLVTSESRELVKYVGQVLLVVRSVKTPRRAVMDAIQLLGEQVAIGLVLNQGRPSLLDGLYGYGYGYGAYGDYGDQPPAPAA